MTPNNLPKELYKEIILINLKKILGGSWGVISGVIGKVTIVITHVRGLITPLITTHEPPSSEHL